MILYIHIPFCSSKCGYCAFNSSDSLPSLQDEYISALLLDLAHQIKGQTFASIYFGGGTPNILHQRHYEKIFNLIAKESHLTPQCEITLECNPNLVHPSWCQDLKKIGANRISLGVQSFFEKKLEFLQRDHKSYDIWASIDTIHKSGISNISCDLIYNTPFDTLDHLSLEIEKLKELEISHLSAYALSIDQGSKFYQNPPKLPSWDHSFKIREMLKEIGFHQYEVSSYYKTHKSNHNLAYWKGEDYIGCGAGGVGCIGNIRMWGSKHIPSYIKHPTFKHQEVLSQEDKRFERIFLGLRCEEGISLKEICPQKVQTLLKEQKCLIQKDHLVALDFFLADEIALWLS